jgi:hemoglobin/transferrin/lactoferrin receptor protein
MTMRIPIICFFMFSLASILFAQQTDTLLLHPEQLVEKDIHDPQATGGQVTLIIPGSRFPVDAQDSPFSTYIITKEEIRRNGYETLVDALKMVPGIQVSQPGSANEGETFLMRGLLGNGYAKILINDVPIRPAFLPTMPIGAQLPIREAERIEVVFGTGSVLWGCDGAAGTINIITKESDKPVFMQADLSAGGGGYNSANVMFGGRLGRDKRIFKYFAYGSYTSLEGRNITKGHFTNYDPLLYSIDSSYFKSPNYLGSYNAPVISNIPHFSRKFGLNLKYQRFTFSANAMYRRDHSSLGLNPTAFSYSNPQTFTGESILHMNLGIYKQKEKKGRTINRLTNLSYMQYTVDPGSSALALYPQLASLLRQGAESEAALEGGDSATVYFNRAYNRNLTGARYFFGHSTEWRLEHIRNYRMFKKLTFSIGANFHYANGRPRNMLIPRTVVPAKNRFFGYTEGFTYDPTTVAFISRRYNAGGNNYFFQFFYNGKKLKLVAGGNLSAFVFGREFTTGSSFLGTQSKLAGLYKLRDNLNLRASWGKTYTPANGYQFEASRSLLGSDLFRGRDSLKTERSKSWEVGSRWQSKNGMFSFDMAYFSFVNKDLIRYGHSVDSIGFPFSNYEAEIGFRNLPNSILRIKGIQASLASKFKLLSRFQVESRISFNWQDAELEASGNLLQQHFALQMPEMPRIWQFSLDVRPNEKTSFILSTIHYYNPNQDGFTLIPFNYFVPDLDVRYAFTNRFDGYLKIINFFNREYKGIPVIAAPADRMFYNPQSGFFLRLGMNYSIE